MDAYKIAVFTPTYNRARLLPQLFESLQEQTRFDFYWLVVDDGSTDDTRDVVESFQKTAKFEIKYVYKENGGKHTAINMMLDMINAELVLIVDSDDFISEDTIETILQDYSNLNTDGPDTEDICQMIYLRATFNGAVIGDSFPVDCGLVDPIECMVNGGVKGDKCDVLVTKAFRNCRFPVYPAENFMGETVLWYLAYQKDRKIFVRNKVLYYCEYREDGLTMSGRPMRIRQPFGGMAHANSYLFDGVRPKLRLKYSVLYICYGLFAGKTSREIYKGMNDKRFFAVGYPPGIMLYHYWRRRFGEA